MGATVTPILSNPDPTWNPTNLAQLWAFLNLSFETVNVSGGPFTPYVIKSTTPDVSDNDKAWIVVDGNGRPLGIKLFYNGNWRAIYTGKAGEVTNFSGNPAGTDSFGISPMFDPATHLGTVGGQWDGWVLCTTLGHAGNSNVPDLSDKFIVAGSVYSSGWQSNIEGGPVPKQSGGSVSYAIKNTDLPYMQVSVVGAKYNAGISNPGHKRIIVDDNWGTDNLTPENNPIAQFGSNPSGSPPVPQTTVPTVPVYYALAYAMFVGYA